MSDNVIKIGELLVRAGVVTGVDLSEAEKLAKQMSLQFGRVLIMSGCLSEHDLDCALVAQQLIREELLTVEVACQALAVAAQHQMPFEDALEALDVVPKYGTATVDLAELLADAAIIPGEMLEEALMTSLRTNVTLGDLLVKENAISPSLIPILNTMLADIAAGVLLEAEAINEIRKTYYTWRRAQDSLSNNPISQPPVLRMQEVSQTPVFVSQELMHSFELYEPQPQQQQQSQQSYNVSAAAPPAYAESPQSAPHSIHDVLSMFQQRNPAAEASSPPPPPEQQAASWTAFVQSQSFDPADVESQTPPMSVVEEPRYRNPDETSRPIEVVQGNFAKTFDGKTTDRLADSFEPFVPPAFEPAQDIEDEPPPAHVLEFDQSDDGQSTDAGVEQFSPLVELLIESGYFDREDIIVAITNALREETKAIKLIEVLGLADAKAVVAASICSDALRKFELNPDEAISVLCDIKGGAEIHEALEAVNLELAVTVSANMQMFIEDEVDDSFYVGDVSRTVDIFDNDDFAEEQKQAAAAARLQSAEEISLAPPVEVSLEPPVEVSVEPPVVSAEVDVTQLAFGYGRERLKIAKAGTPAPTPTPEPPVVSNETPPEESPTSIEEELPQAVITDVDDKKRVRKRNAITFNSLQAVFVSPTEALNTLSEPANRVAPVLDEANRGFVASDNLGNVEVHNREDEAQFPDSSAPELTRTMKSESVSEPEESIQAFEPESVSGPEEYIQASEPKSVSEPEESIQAFEPESVSEPEEYIQASEPESVSEPEESIQASEPERVSEPEESVEKKVRATTSKAKVRGGKAKTAPTKKSKPRK